MRKKREEGKRKKERETRESKKESGKENENVCVKTGDKERARGERGVKGVSRNR